MLEGEGGKTFQRRWRQASLCWPHTHLHHTCKRHASHTANACGWGPRVDRGIWKDPGGQGAG